MFKLFLAFMLSVVPLTSVLAKTMECQGNCKPQPGDICLSSEWIPKEGAPTECRTEFHCAQDKTVFARAYFKPIGQYAKWVLDPKDNTGRLKYIGSIFNELNAPDSTRYGVQYTDWALSPEKADVTSQGEAFRGKSPGGLNYFHKEDHSRSPEYFCQKVPEKTLEWYWQVLGTKNIYTGRVIERVVGDSIVKEKETQDMNIVLAEGRFKMHK